MNCENCKKLTTEIAYLKASHNILEVIKHMAVMEVKEGDVLIVYVDHRIDADFTKRLLHTVNHDILRYLGLQGKVQVAIFSDGLEFSVLRNGEKE